MPTVADVITKVSGLRSKRAALYALRVHLQTHYIGSEAGPAAYTITRDDNALVPHEHLVQVLEDLDEQIEAAELEMKSWEQLLVVDPETKQKSKSNGKRTKKTGSRGKVQAQDTESEPGGSQRVV